MVAAHVEAGIVGVVRIAGTGQVQAANHRMVGIEHHDRAAIIVDAQATWHGEVALAPAVTPKESS